jgi:hypothetical protein
MPVATSFVSPPLGHSIPYLTPHAVSVSLPTWQDNVGYEEGDKRVVDAMQTGYPRFFVHRSIQKVRLSLYSIQASMTRPALSSGGSVGPASFMHERWEGGI